ncbi:beta-3-deoxy-D-manno-oct-2-ulosonic acid transferase [Komagataeibacter sp. FNDCF1]|uniref:capsular polysaccharide export protein, LipB/KpsS family n=1 Tax=Komagataeibacter sp. FNDCF1 TaxID=2878681 RepID=UPI001E54910F|nr:beta-3-deoxy-D-manno-oct-2-ulosonic acid transferase [Komagataeibacter sp. FNDCF1]MCE2566096.1 beta-3-deoxy-D-manno-oct-2-ulosonic acid transferase [Komagataeibacter sp. FNDCF1]
MLQKYKNTDIVLFHPSRHGRVAAFARRHNIRHFSAPLDPHVLLDHVEQVHEVGNGDLGALAALRGLKVLRHSSQGHGRPLPLEGEAVARALLSDWVYVDPFDKTLTDIHNIIEILTLWRQVIDENRQIGACVGMSLWKRRRITDFLATPPAGLRFARSGRRALKLCRGDGSAIAMWATRVPPGLEEKASRENIPLWRVEDGFVRSVGLGSGLQVPASIILDKKGIYYDPTQPSDLEHILATARFDPALRQRARALRHYLVHKGITKYGRADQSGMAEWNNAGRRTILVPGQVSDDQSVLRGGGRIRGNLELLMEVRCHNPDAFIIYRPHPDVTSGHRSGTLRDEDVLAYADHVSYGGAITALMAHVDEIHTLTSLAGFEGLLRGITVVTYGGPFYAGWGLTRDMGDVPWARRGRMLHIEELVAGALILYPRYLDPLTRLPCEAEVLVNRFEEPALWRPTPLMRAKLAYGRVKVMVSQHIRRGERTCRSRSK